MIRWIELQRLIVEIKYDWKSNQPPENLLRKKLWNICESNRFEAFVLFIIILNVILMALSYENSTETYDKVIVKLNLGFTIFFMLECVLKLTAYGFTGYFIKGWN